MVWTSIIIRQQISSLTSLWTDQKAVFYWLPPPIFRPSDGPEVRIKTGVSSNYSFIWFTSIKLTTPWMPTGGQSVPHTPIR